MSRLKRAPMIVFLATALLALLLLSFEIYVFLARRGANVPLPPLFGNFERVRQTLKETPPETEFTFGVCGDTRSVGTFEELAGELRKRRLAFAVLLGDCVYYGAESEHAALRAELAHELAMPFPVFYVTGNHDVSEDRFPVSRFEEVYGPSIFSFDCQGCLFVILRILDAPASNRDSIEFLRRLAADAPDRYRKRFVFMHIPAPVPGLAQGRSFAEGQELLEILRELGADYVFAGDYHGYSRTTYRGTSYIVTGGGGGHLHQKDSMHHAVLVTVGADGVSEEILAVPRNEEFEDFMERFAISEAWPWMRLHPALAAAANAAVLLALIGSLTLWQRSPRRP
ncbi:MAG: metallophosphoesterase [Planctomycetota bacterium]